MVKNLEKTLFFLLLFLLPSQLSHHWWPSWSLVHGLRIDYLSPTLYLTDLLLITLLFLGYRVLFKHRRVFAAWFLLAAVNSFFSILPVLSIYKWLRLGLLIGLVVYVAENSAWTNKMIFRGLSWALVWTSFLAILQFLNQGAVGGLWYWLGERNYSINTPGIAKVFVTNIGQVVRPYATLPHPNALAGWLGLSLIILSGFSKLPKMIAGLTIGTVMLSLSRLGLVALVMSWKKWWAVVLVFGIALLLPSNPDSWSERQTLIVSVIEQIKQFPVYGTGLGSSVVLSPINFQPVHNIYLLAILELGIPLALLIIFVVFKSFYKKVGIWSTGIIFIFLTGMGDHYWFTLWQNNLLAAIFIALLTVELWNGKSESLLRRRGPGESGTSR